MSTSSIDIVREIVHIGSAILIVTVLIVAIIGCIKPSLLRRLMKEFSERRYIFGSAVFICLLCATIFTATQPTTQPLQSNTTKPEVNSAETLDEPANQDMSETQPQPVDPSVESSAENSNPGSIPASPPTSTSPAPAPSGSASQSAASLPQSQPTAPQNPSGSRTPAPQPRDNTECRLGIMSLCLIR